MLRFAAEQELSERTLDDVCGGAWRFGFNTRITADYRNYGIQDVTVEGDGNIFIRGDRNIVAGRDLYLQPAKGA